MGLFMFCMTPRGLGGYGVITLDSTIRVPGPVCLGQLRMADPNTSP